MLLICSSQGLVYAFWEVHYHPETADQAQVSQASTVYKVGKLGAEWPTVFRHHLQLCKQFVSTASVLQLAKGYSPLLLNLVRSKADNTELSQVN